MNEVVIMPDQEKRSIDEIMEDLQRINQEFRERVRDGFKNPDDFIKLSEIEKMGRELSLNTQKLYLEETTSLLNDIDESLLIRKKNRVQRKRDKSYPFTTRSSKYHNDQWSSQHFPPETTPCKQREQSTFIKDGRRKKHRSAGLFFRPLINIF